MLKAGALSVNRASTWEGTFAFFFSDGLGRDAGALSVNGTSTLAGAVAVFCGTESGLNAGALSTNGALTLAGTFSFGGSVGSEADVEEG